MLAYIKLSGAVRPRLATGTILKGDRQHTRLALTSGQTLLSTHYMLTNAGCMMLLNITSAHSLLFWILGPSILLQAQSTNAPVPLACFRVLRVRVWLCRSDITPRMTAPITLTTGNWYQRSRSPTKYIYALFKVLRAHLARSPGVAFLSAGRILAALTRLGCCITWRVPPPALYYI